MKLLFQIIFLSISWILTSCNNQSSLDKEKASKQESSGTTKQDIEKNMLEEQEIIAHVRKAINPKFKDWVLFSNGTYIILEDSTVMDKTEKAIAIMKEYGPIHAGSPAGDITITKLTYTEGWVVGGHYYGMYTYVHPKQLEDRGIKNPSDLDVGLAGRQNRDKDGKELKTIYINR